MMTTTPANTKDLEADADEPVAITPVTAGSAQGVEVVTFGCRLNALESEVMAQKAGAAGVDNTILINTCAVTAEAVRQARQAIRKAKRQHPEARVVVSGCAAQIDPEQFAQMDEVDAVLGNEEKLTTDAYQRLPDFGVSATQKVLVNDIMSVEETAGHLVEGLSGRTRAFVQVQNGCDHRCTFCIIPYGRGNSRSVPVGEVVRQVRILVENGYREVVLTGVDMTSYGPDLPGQPRLGELVLRILKLVPDLQRLRLSSIDSIEADQALLQAIAEEERLMPHLHLSLQAGHDLTLKRMKRRHLTADAEAFCKEAKRLRPDIVFGADLIAGFPTETDDMFQATLDHVEACGLTFLHVFPYSPRPGTPAAKMPQLPGPLIKDRAARLRALGADQLAKHMRSEVGRERSVLGERDGYGRTECFTPVQVPGLIAGDIARCRITGHDCDHLIATLR